MVKKKFISIRNIAIGNLIYEWARLIRDTRRAFSQFGVIGDKWDHFRGIVEAHQKYGWYPVEYFYYHYCDLTEVQRRSFIGEKEYTTIAETMNNKNSCELLSDKWETYCLFKPYFQRVAMLYGGGNNRTDFLELLKEKKRLIIKPLLGSFGKGIRIVDTAHFEKGSMEDFFEHYKEGFIAEEVIVQDERMSVLHPESVNTLRIHTICYNNQVSVFHPYIRIGRGNSCVDNAGSGGIFSACNTETGEVTKIVDESGHAYTTHPDNDYPLIGFKVPMWDEAFQLAEELARQLPGLHYAGWDLALSEKGWVLVEGNPRAQNLFQISEQKGFRDELASILNKHGVKMDVAFKTGRKTY